MAEGQEYAVVLPKPTDGLGTFLSVMEARKDQMLKNQQEAEKKKSADDKEQGELLDYGLKMVNEKDLLTGDPRMDPEVKNRITVLQKEITEYLLKNKGKASKFDMVNTFYPKANELGQYKQKAQAYQANKKALLEENKGIPGFDAGIAGSMMDSTFYGSGNIDEMNADPDKLRATLSDNMHRAITSDKGITDWAKGQGIHSLSKSVYKKDASGKSVRDDISYKLPTYMDIMDDGQPDVVHEKFRIDTPPQSFDFKAGGKALTRGQKIEAQVYLGDVLDKDNEGSVKMVTEEIFENLMRDRGASVALQSMVRAVKDEYEAETGDRFAPGPATENMLLRGMAYKMLKQYGSDALKENKSVSEPKITVNVGGSGGGKPTAAEVKAQKAMDMYNKAAHKAITQEGLEKALLGKTEKVRVKNADGTSTSMQLHDVTPNFYQGQFKTGKGAGARVYVVPGKPGTVYVKMSADEPVQAMTGEEANAFFRNMMNANTVTEFDPVSDAQDMADYNNVGSEQPAEPVKEEKKWYNPTTWFN